MESNNQKKEQCRTKKNSGLILYYHPYSFNSQKVLMVLHEKHLPFEARVINLVKNEQYEPDFLNLNPKGEVPVLEDNGKVIGDCSKIIDYLEDNFRNDPIRKLIPIEEGMRVRQKVTYFRSLIEQVQSGILTLGSCNHEEHLRNPKLPFIRPVRAAMKNAESKRGQFFELQSENFPQYRHIFRRKLMNCQRRHEIIADPKEFLFQLQMIETVLDKVDDELVSHETKSDSNEYWLCTKCFTVADISLAILLERLDALGLSHRFWDKSKRPHIEEYFARVRKRESFKKSIPNLRDHLTLLYQGHPNVVLFSGALTVSVLLLGGMFLSKK